MERGIGGEVILRRGGACPLPLYEMVFTNRRNN